MTDEQRLREELLAMTAEPSAKRRARARTAVETAVSKRPRRRRRWGAGLGALAAIGLLLSPPGQALAERLGELVGIGEESSVTATNLRDPRLNEQQERVGPAIVTATGIVPVTGERFEILAWAARQKRPEDLPPNVGAPVRDGELVTCMGQVFPEIGRQETGKVCVGPRRGPEPLHVFGMGTEIVEGETSVEGAPYSVVGTAAADTRRVDVAYEDPESGSTVHADATLGRIDEEVAARTGAEEPFSFFVAYLPYDGADRGDPKRGPSLPESPVLESAVVTAYDEEGEPFASEEVGEQYARSAKQSRRSRARVRADQVRIHAAQLAACRALGGTVAGSVCPKAHERGVRSPRISELAAELVVNETPDGTEVSFPDGFGPLTVELGDE